MMPQSEVYQQIENILLYKKKSMASFSRDLGVSVMGLHKTFKKQTLTLSMLVKIAAVLEVPVLDLLGSEPEKNIVNEPAPAYGVTPVEEIKQLAQRIIKLADNL